MNQCAKNQETIMPKTLHKICDPDVESISITLSVMEVQKLWR